MASDDLHGPARHPLAGAPNVGAQGPPLNPDEAAVTFEPGQLIGGQFVVRGVLGRGPSGVSYRVVDQSTQQKMILKAVYPSKLARPEVNRRFVREMNLARRLRHEGLVTVHDLREIDGLTCFAVEYVDGANLRRISVKRGPLPLRSAGGIIARVCRTLEYAHEFTVHAHLTPEQIIVRNDLVVKVLDLGLARSLGAPEVARLGPTPYLAPELHAPDAQADLRADIYSLGVIFFEMLTGQLPGEGKRLSQLRPDVPEALERVIARAIGPRDQRFGSVKELREIIERVLLEEKHAAKTATTEAVSAAPLPAIPSIPRTPADTPTHRRKRLPWGSATEWENWERNLKTTQVRPRKRKRGVAWVLNLVIGACFVVGMVGLIMALGPDYARRGASEPQVRHAVAQMNTAPTMGERQGLAETPVPAAVSPAGPTPPPPRPAPPPQRSAAHAPADTEIPSVESDYAPEPLVPTAPLTDVAPRREKTRLVRQLTGHWAGPEAGDPNSTWNVRISTERIEINGPGHRFSGVYDVWRGERFVEFAYRVDMAAMKGAVRNYEPPDNLVNMIAELADATHLRLALNPPNDPRRPTGFQHNTLGISLDLALQ